MMAGRNLVFAKQSGAGRNLVLIIWMRAERDILSDYIIWMRAGRT
jgi:hypothetical protein